LQSKTLNSDEGRGTNAEDREGNNKYRTEVIHYKSHMNWKWGKGGQRLVSYLQKLCGDFSVWIHETKMSP